MKQSMMTVLNILFFTTFIFAGTPPAAVKKAFDQKFSKATEINWGKENKKEWEAEFVLDGVKVSANFLIDGSWVETEKEIPIAEMPIKVSEAIKQQHTNYEVVGVYRIESAVKPVKYEADIKKGKSKKEVIYFEDGKATK